MQCILEVWDRGDTTPFDMAADAVIEFKKRTGNERVVGIRWTYQGAMHSLSGYGHVLPDRSGVALARCSPDEKRSWLEVFNADGSLRFRMSPPDIAPVLEHETARIQGVRPGGAGSGIQFGVLASYMSRPEPGKTQLGVTALLDIDWRTGTFKGVNYIERY